MLGGVLQRHARNARHQNAALRRCRKIDAVGACADALDQLELGIGIHRGGIDRATAKDDHLDVAAFADVEFRRHRDQRDAIGLVQSASGIQHPRRVHVFGQEKIAHVGFRNLTGTGQGVAGDADDMVVIEDGDLQGAGSRDFWFWRNVSPQHGAPPRCWQTPLRDMPSRNPGGGVARPRCESLLLIQPPRVMSGLRCQELFGIAPVFLVCLA
jgi:hypothetical protein